MSLIKHIKKISRVLFLSGFCPFTIDTKRNRVHCKWYILLLIILKLLLYLLSALYLSFLVISQHLLVSISKIHKVLYITDIVILDLTYNLTLILSLIYKNKHIKLLNKIISIEDKLNILMNSEKYQKNNILLYFYIVLFFNISVNLINLIWEPLNNKIYLIFILVSLGRLTFSLLFLSYKCFLAYFLYQQTNRLHCLLRDIFSANIKLKCNQIKLFTLMLLTDEIYNLKRLYYKVFGLQLLLAILLDFFLITTTFFSIIISSKIKKNNLENTIVMLISMFPTVTKIVMVVHIMDRFTNQV